MLIDRDQARYARFGFTLIESLVVIAIVDIDLTSFETQVN